MTANETLLQQLYPSVQRAIAYLASRDNSSVGVPNAQPDSAWADWYVTAWVREPGLTGLISLSLSRGLHRIRGYCAVATTTTVLLQDGRRLHDWTALRTALVSGKESAMHMDSGIGGVVQADAAGMHFVPWRQ